MRSILWENKYACNKKNRKNNHLQNRFFIYLHRYFEAEQLQNVLYLNAQMAELVDALVSGTSIRLDVQVRVLFWAHENKQNVLKRYILNISALVLLPLSYLSLPSPFPAVQKS